MKLKLLIAILIVGAFASCQNKQKTYVPEPENKHIKVGAMAGPEADLVRAAARVGEERFGLQVEVIEFTDYVSPNAALADGSIDLNAYQTLPYMQEAMDTRGYRFVDVGKTFLYPLGLYSKKFKTFEDLPKKLKIGISNDPSNESRGLLLLQEAGLIDLPKGIGMKATVIHMKQKKGLDIELVALEAAQIPRVLEDLDLGIINTNYAVPAGLKHGEDTVYLESTDSPYTNLIAAREDEKNNINVERFVTSYQSQLVIDKAKELFGDKAIPGFTAK